MNAASQTGKPPWPPGAVATLWTLSVTQIIAWGTLYYGITLIGPRIMAETGWSKTLIYGAFSLALLASGLVAPRVGALIDKHGGRLIMTAGSVVGGLGYAMMAVAQTPVVFYAAYIVIGLGMAGSLYDPAFASLARICGSRARTAITILTLGGGLASTVFWPLGLWLLDFTDWRGLALIYAVLNGVLCALLHLLGVSSRRAGAEPAAASPQSRPGDAPLIPPALRNRAIALLALIFLAHGLVSNGMSVHLVTIFASLGLSEAEAVSVGALIGPSQSFGRLVELAMGGAYPVMRLGYVAIGSLPLAFAVVIAAGAGLAVYLFAFIYGISNGLATIARGVMTLGLLGRENYGRTLGLIAGPSLAAKAAAPIFYAMLIDAFGAGAALWFMLGCGLASLAAVAALSLLLRQVGRDTTP